MENVLGIRPFASTAARTTPDDPSIARSHTSAWAPGTHPPAKTVDTTTACNIRTPDVNTPYTWLTRTTASSGEVPWHTHHRACDPPPGRDDDDGFF
jgi:hypothetical protein